MKSRQRAIFKKILRLALGLSISGWCVYSLVGQVNGQEVLNHFEAVNLKLVILAFIVTVLSYFLRAYRWKFLFADTKLPFFVSYRSLIIGFFMNNILPGRIGEFVRAHSLGVVLGKSKTSVLATVAAERLADGLTISLLFAILFSLFGGSSGSAGLIFGVAYMFALACILTFVTLYFRKPIFKLIRRLDKKLGKKGVSYLLVRVERFIIGLEPLFMPRLIPSIIFFSLAVWGVELLAYSLVAKSFSQNLDLGSLSLFLAAVNFSSLLPALPGGVGTIEKIATASLAKIGLPSEIALSLVITQHAIQYLAVGIPGLVFTIFGKKNSKSEQTASAPEQVVI